MKRLNGAGVRALDTIKQFTVAQRTIAIIGVAVVVLGGVALANWLGKPTYQVLYSNISAANASAVTAQLTKDNVDYQLADGGTTIMVPAASVDQERLATASLLSSGAGGYSLLDGLGITASEFQQNITYKRAIEGELAKTIESIDGVSAASVQLAIPQQTVFTDQKEDPTASVFVNVSTALTGDQVNAIVHLVSAAYPGMKTDNVSVVDQKGDTLSAVGGSTGSASDSAAAYEATTKTAIQGMLDKVLGPGNAVVTVAADVSNSSGTKKSETYTGAGNTPALSESTNSTSYANGGGAAANGGASGVLGVDTTNPTVGGGATGGNSSSTTAASGSPTYQQLQSVKNNAVNKTVTDQTIVPGTLNRQTIAVALNSAAAARISTTQLQQMVANAAGVNTSRGDTVSVTSVAFSTAAAKSAAAALAQGQAAQGAQQMTSIITTAIQVVGGLGLLVLVLTIVRRLFRRPEPLAPADGPVFPMTVPGGAPLGGTAPTAQLGGMGGLGALGGGGYTGLPTVALDPSVDPAYAQMQADVDALAGGDPERTAEYLRALMSDPRALA